MKKCSPWNFGVTVVRPHEPYEKYEDHALTVVFFSRIFSLQIDAEGSVIFLYSDRSKPNGKIYVKVWD